MIREEENKNTESSAEENQNTQQRAESASEKESENKNNDSEVSEVVLQSIINSAEVFTHSTDNFDIENAPRAEFDVAMRKKKNVPVIIGISGAFLIVLLALLYLFVPYINNSISKLILKPEQYYQKVEKLSLAKSWGSINNKLTFSENAPNIAYDFESDININSDNLKNIIGTNTLSLKNNFSINNNQDHGMLDSTITLNNQKLFDINSILDNVNKNIYIQIPQLSDSYIKDSLSEVKSKNIRIKNYLFFAEKASGYILSKSSNVEFSSNVRKNNSDFAVLTVKYDDNFKNSLQNEIKSQLLNDADLKSVFSGEDYPAVVEKAVDYLTTLDNMVVFIDNKGKILGRTFTFDNKTSFSYLTVNNSKNLFYSMKITSETDETTVVADLTKYNDTYSGTVYSEKNGTKNIDLMIDKVRVTSNKNFGYTFAGKILGKYKNNQNASFDINFNCGEQSGNIDATFLNGDISTGEFKLKYTESSKLTENITIPGKSYDMDHLKEYMEQTNIEEFSKILAENLVIKNLLNYYVYGIDAVESIEADKSADFVKSSDLSGMEITINKKYFGLPSKTDHFIEALQFDSEILPGEKKIAKNDEQGISVEYMNYSDKTIDGKDSDITSLLLTEKAIEFFNININGIKLGSSEEELTNKFGDKLAVSTDNSYVMYDSENDIALYFYMDKGKITSIMYMVVNF